MRISFLRPETPTNGIVKTNGELTVGRMVKFHCNPGYMMKGQPIMTCSEATANGQYIGKWIGEVPTCVKACTYPGTVIGGIMVSDVKFYYSVGSKVQYECSPGLTLFGAPMLECLGNGIWSNSVPLCQNP